MKLLPFEYAVRNLSRSTVRLIAGVTSVSLVVLLMLAAAAFVRGMTQSLAVSGESKNVILLGAGSEESIERSQISASVPGVLGGAIRGIQSRLRTEYISPEVHMAMIVRRDRDASQELPAVLRGITDAAWLVHSQVRLVEGQIPRPAQGEIIVGSRAHRRLGVSEDDVAIGRTLWFDQRPWKIVGRFSAGGSVMDAELWLPLSDLQIATKRDTLSCVVFTLGEAEFADVDAFCKQRLDLELIALRETDYYAGLMGFYAPIRFMVWMTATLVALGGLFGGLNTLYAAFAPRIRELATLQVVGYSRAAILVGMVQESVLVASLGGLLGAGVGLALLDRISVRFGAGAFGLSVDSAAVAIGLATALGLGIVGALPPAWRCLRAPIAKALRS